MLGLSSGVIHCESGWMVAVGRTWVAKPGENETTFNGMGFVVVCTLKY